MMMNPNLDKLDKVRFNATLWRVFVTIVVMETQKCLPFVLLKHVCVTVNKVTDITSVAVEAQPYVLCIVVLHMVLPTV